MLNSDLETSASMEERQLRFVSYARRVCGNIMAVKKTSLFIAVHYSQKNTYLISRACPAEVDRDDGKSTSYMYEYIF